MTVHGGDTSAVWKPDSHWTDATEHLHAASEDMLFAGKVDGPSDPASSSDAWLAQYGAFLNALDPRQTHSIGQRAGLMMTTVKAFGAWAHAPMMVADHHTGVGFAEALEDTLSLRNLKQSVPALVAKWKELDSAIELLDDLGPAAKGMLKLFSKIQVIDAVADAVGVTGSIAQALTVTAEFAGQAVLDVDERTLAPKDVASSWVEALENVAVILSTQTVAIKLAPIFYGAATTALAAIGVTAAPAAAVIGLAAVGTVAATMGVDYAISSFSTFVQDQINGAAPPKWLRATAQALSDLSTGMAGQTETRTLQIGEVEMTLDLGLLHKLSDALERYANQSDDQPMPPSSRTAPLPLNYGSSELASINDTIQAVMGQSPWDIGRSAAITLPDGTLDVLNHGNTITAITEPVIELASTYGTLPEDRRIRSNAHAGQIIDRTLGVILVRHGSLSEEYSGAIDRLRNAYDLDFGSELLGKGDAEPVTDIFRPDDYSFVRAVFAGFYRDTAPAEPAERESRL